MLRVLRLPIALAVAVSMLAVATVALAEPPATPEFQRTWDRTDKPVADGAVSRTWMWGPKPFTGPLLEDYAEAPDGQRIVQYTDKSRFEDNTWRDPAVDPPWDVTNGLLVVELTSGMQQDGDDTHVEREPADVHVAGDPGYPDAPTYATFGGLLDEAPYAVGATIAETVDGNGTIGHNHDLIAHGVTAAILVEETNHTVASVFWDLMNSEGLVHEDGMLVTAPLFINPFYATGLPITEAYWVFVYVGGTPQWVLVQAFERRVLTYTPGNDEGWQVEAGNVGQHYFEWRYGEHWLVPLSGDEEVPPVETDATGTALFYLSEDGEALHYSLSVHNLENFTMAHIHYGEVGVNAGVTVWLHPPTPPATLIEGVFSGILATGTITDAEISPLETIDGTLESLLDAFAAEETYVNVHTSANPAGEIRGQIR
jgi:hypothetical protein